MPIIDIIIITVLSISMIIGFVRGFVKEIISLFTLLFAIWASSYFGATMGNYFDPWIDSSEIRIWSGRVFIFVLILFSGSILGWLFSKLIRLVMLGGIDRLVGSLFGVIRGLLFIGLFVIMSQYSGFDSDVWWTESKLLPHFEKLADWIRVIAPKGFEFIISDDLIEKIPEQLPMDL